MAKTNEPQGPSASVSLIGVGTNIKGEVKCSGDLRIDGSVDGTVEAEGKVVVGEAGKIYGEVICRNADISGYLKGKIGVRELLAIKATARLEGEIVTQKLSIEPGSKFTGTCHMGEIEDPRANGQPARATADKE